ncbi:TetR family transcriptional regulator [Micromonospora pisi]|uniref:TetR family transcriptional regulator n=1 Tax=Micromonospora pisi TaxID=589240 RepID=A0A495JGC4_9ACTN|nr:TetR/AcrR family transcriptional regulator [Micromonospora pisi]RKR87933.1 TetR family transcriptional regulator [Micromonospora pisi]
MASADSDDEIPRSLRVLWGRTDRRPRAPQPALNLDRIVATAIEIADTDGIGALSMARLAERLGCATMSLYRHVANKEELQVFMMDAAPGDPPDIQTAPGDWRAGLERWARELQAVYYRHPWILQITAGHPPLEPGQLAWLDCGLRTLTGTRLDPQEKMKVILLVLNYVRGEAQIALTLHQATGPEDHTDHDRQIWYGRMLTKLVDAEHLPALAELSTAGTFDPGRLEAHQPPFDFALARILDGLEVLLRSETLPPGRQAGP